MMVGLVIGIGIFKRRSSSRSTSTAATTFIGLWVLGGVITLIGALVYAELGGLSLDRRRVSFPVPRLGRESACCSPGRASR